SFLGIKNIVATGSVMWSGGSVKLHGYIKPQTVPGGQYAQVIILILLTVVTGYIASKMMVTDPKQSKMMAFMPVLFGVFAWILPAGITIYIIVTNVLTIVQQYFQLKREGFYQERDEQREKAGEPTGLLERYKYYWSGALVRLKLRPPEKPGAKKAAPKAKGAKPVKEVEKDGTKKLPAGKKPAGKQPPRTQPAKKQQVQKPASKTPVKKGGTKSYPAKKQSPKKK
ncbi:MAG: YidC/Oxa1 family membrane protein insertase, partial [Dehalococcoidia bacterium]|nr:YidC/Oxa1 family membrane protein insertase [Dehalococcoidia bacterium]